MAPKVTKKTLETIVTPSNTTEVLRVCNIIMTQAEDLVVRYVPGIRQIPLNQGLVFAPTWKSVPSASNYRKRLVERLKAKGLRLRSLTRKSLFPSFCDELRGFRVLDYFARKLKFDRTRKYRDNFFF